MSNMSFGTTRTTADSVWTSVLLVSSILLAVNLDVEWRYLEEIWISTPAGKAAVARALSSVILQMQVAHSVGTEGN